MRDNEMEENHHCQQSHDWLYQDKYSRYWQHYAAMQSWMSMYTSMHRARYSWYPPPGYQPTSPNQLTAHPPAWHSPHTNSNTHRVPTIFASSAPHYHNEADHEYSEDGLSESESMDIEMSEEMLEFFRTSQKFREERDRAKAEAVKAIQASRKKQGDPMKAGDQQDCRAPVERPDEARRKGMKVLYGKHSARIHAMETAMQMKFDQNCDHFQPSFWPIVALKL